MKKAVVINNLKRTKFYGYSDFYVEKGHEHWEIEFPESELDKLEPHLIYRGGPVRIVNADGSDGEWDCPPSAFVKNERFIYDGRPCEIFGSIGFRTNENGEEVCYANALFSVKDESMKTIEEYTKFIIDILQEDVKDGKLIIKKNKINEAKSEVTIDFVFTPKKCPKKMRVTFDYFELTNRINCKKDNFAGLTYNRIMRDVTGCPLSSYQRKEVEEYMNNHNVTENEARYMLGYVPGDLPQVSVAEAFDEAKKENPNVELSYQTLEFWVDEVMKRAIPKPNPKLLIEILRENLTK